MATYVVTGVSRGIGYGFLGLLSENSNNVVVGIVRDKPATDKKVSEDATLKGRSNIHIVEADLTNYNALKKASEEAAKITGGKVDYLIANAGLISLFDAYDPIGKLGDKPEELEKTMKDLFQVNVIANIHLFNLFLPLILKSNIKKVITITSGFADVEWTNSYDLTPGSLYSVSKAAMNMVTAKYSAQYKQDGVLFMGLSPGMVEVGLYKDATPEQIEGLTGTLAKFTAYSPSFAGPITPEESTRAMQSVWEKASIENGNGGDFLSHKGDKTWL